MLKSTLLLLLNPTCLKCLFVYVSMQSYPRHTVLIGKSRKAAPSLCSLGQKLSAVLPERQHKPSPESQVTMCRTTGAYTAHMHTLAMGQPAQSASVDEKGKATNPLVWRPQLSTFTHRVMNHECELSSAPADTLLCEWCISDQKRKIRRLQGVFKTYKKNCT